MSQAITYINPQTKSKYLKEVAVMESSRYWQEYGEREKHLSDRRLSVSCFRFGKRGEEIDRDIFVYGNRAMSLEVYLTVPTFIRRGLSITDRLCR
jgi:hypothetical protein